MESEIVAEIHEFSTACLHVDETENVLNAKDELSKGNYSEKGTKLTSLQVVDTPGQIVPSQESKANGCLNSETEVSQNNGHSTVPQASLEPMDYLEESEHFSKQREMNEEKTPEGRGFELQFTSSMSISCESNKHAKHFEKTFLWPPIGFKDQITEQAAPNGLDTFEQVVSYTNEENNENEITNAKQVPLTTTTTSSNPVNQSETNSAQDENKNLTSILKKDENQPKKTVHFPENIVSVKFYDISDDDDSDNDTVILSDPEEDDLRDQEVPFNTCDDYSTHYLHPSSTSMNFIPQFSFPPVLKISNCHMYDNIDDDDEQIMAIMDDDDGREQSFLANDLATDLNYHDENKEEYHDEQLNSIEVKALSENQEVIYHGGSATEYQDGEISGIEVKKLSENPEEVIGKIEVQSPMTKYGIERFENELKVRVDGSMGECQDKTEVKRLVSYREESISKCQDDQLTSMELKKLFQNPEEEIELQISTKNNGIERHESHHEDIISEYQDDKLTSTTEVKKLSEEDKAIGTIEVQTPITKNGMRRLEDDLKVNADKNMNKTIETESLVMNQAPPVSGSGIDRFGNDLEFNTDKNMDKTMESLVVKEKASIAKTVNKRVANSMTFARNDADSKEYIPEVYTLLDALKATRAILSKETNCDTMEGHSVEEKLVKKETIRFTSPERVLGRIAPLTMLPGIECPEFDAQHLDKIKEELAKPDMLLHQETFTMYKPFGNAGALKWEKPCSNKPTIRHSNISSDNFVLVMTKNKELLAKDTPENAELLAENISEAALVLESDVSTKSKENSDSRMNIPLSSSSSSAREFHGNCGSKFLWRGPRTMSSMILDEGFQVTAVPTADNDLLHQRSFTKEEIAFPKADIVDVRSLELNILAALWNERALTKHCLQEFQPTKYIIHSFISPSDYFSEFQETWKSDKKPDFPNKKQKIETDAQNVCLKDGNLKKGFGEHVVQHQAEFHGHHGTNSNSPTTSRDHIQGYTPKYTTIPQVVPDMYVQEPIKAQPMKNSSRAVPSAVDDIMDTTDTSLHDFPSQSRKAFEQKSFEENEWQHQQSVCSSTEMEEEDMESVNHTSVLKQSSGLPYSPTHILSKQGRRKLRVGLSKSARVKPLHPYWSKDRIKEKP